ncbi:MAG: hypothetical protein WC749_06860 [Dehalococcoidia bacterium]
MDIWELTGQIAIFGVGATVIAYGALKWFGQKWFEHQFAQRLESFKREQSELLESYRYQINARFNRITKIHEKEFEVLPEAWHKLQDSYAYLASVASPLQQWPDLNHYSTEQMESFLKQCELLDFQMEELRKTSDKLAYYREKAYWIRLAVAREKFQEFRNFLRYNKIFLSRDLFDLFTKIESAMIKAEVELEYPDDKPWASGSKVFTTLTDTVNKLLEQLEDAVQKRLHFDKA